METRHLRKDLKLLLVTAVITVAVLVVGAILESRFRIIASLISLP